MKVLVNIRGCNGAGKSTIPMQMMDDPDMRIVAFKKHPTVPDKMTAPFLTVFPNYGWVALGTYLNKTGGMDTIATTAEMKEALEYAWKKYPKYDVLMEGIIASTIRSTYIELFDSYEGRVQDGDINPRKIIVVNFLPPLETCLERVSERNGGKPVKEDQIASKWRTVARNVQHFRDAGITTLKVDTSKVKKKEMLPRFEALIHKYREVAD